jgi:precorrin-6A/cobalt-precorrin-6A reductase
VNGSLPAVSEHTGPSRVLVLGGSTEASAFAKALSERDGCEVVVSFAGRTRERVDTPGELRVGGFGGAAGLTRYLRNERIDALVDATHPFAATMPHHAASACGATGVPGVRICRPPWTPVAGDRWNDVADLDTAATAIEILRGRRVFLTTGRQELAPFARLRDVWFLVRAIETPDPMPLASASVVLDRGPFEAEAERRLMLDHGIDLMVSKNSGGSATAAKLTAARDLGLPVVMVARPQAGGLPRVTSVADALEWIDQLGPDRAVPRADQAG